MRLIDADELIKDRVDNDPVVIATKCAPTAYDVDKVVEQLEASSTDDDGIVCYVDRKSVITKEMAVEIVKSGGIAEEKKTEWKEHFASRFGRIE